MSKLVMVTTMKQLDELIAHCKTTRYASHDYETTGLNFHSPSEVPLCLGVSFQPGSAWVIPLAHKESPFKNNWVKVLKKFGKEILENYDVVKIAWNVKFEAKWHMKYGIKCQGRVFDGMLAKYCLDEERPHGLKDFVKVFFPKYDGYAINTSNLANEPYEKVAKYCGIDCDLTLRGMIFLEQRLIKLKFYNLFRNLLMMGSKVLMESEYRGMLIDRPYLEELIKTYKVKMDIAQAKMQNDPALLKFEKQYKKQHLLDLIKNVQLEIAEIKRKDAPNAHTLIKNREQKITNFLNGQFSNKDQYEGMNFNSPKQLAEFFFNSKYGLRLKPLKMTDSGAPSTDEESLLSLVEKDKTGFLTVLMENRGLVKLFSTYIQGTYDKLDHQCRVHTSFKLHGTVTGRLSSENPNLQNIPRGTTSSDIKKMFIPPPGYLMLEVDYSQAELRIVAEIAKDKAMIDIFRKGYNIHVATACVINKCLPDYDVIKKKIKIGEALDSKELLLPKNKDLLFWVKQKKRAKTVNFGILYGQTKKKLSVELECSEQEAQKIIDDWFKSFPQVEKWIKNQVKFVHKHKYVKSLFGRKRRLYNIDSDRFFMKLEAERQSVNTPIQGCASDFTLFSQVVIREQILKGELPRDLHQVATVHDSILYYIRPRDIAKVVPKLVEICNNPQTMQYFNFELEHVRMKVSPEIGISWVDLEEWNPNLDYVAEYKKWCKDGQLMLKYQ